MNGERLAGLRRELVGKFPDSGAEAWRNIELWRSGNPPFIPAEPLEEFVENAPVELLHDCFWRNIPFGTAGVRGTVGFGPNRINPTVVALTIQAHAEFINEFVDSERGAGYERSAVVANDVRRFLDLSGTLKFLSANPYLATGGADGVTSRGLAYLAATVYAANGITVYLMHPGDDDAFLTTPELSYLIRKLRASGGINMSASHNPPDDNGVKVYDENGGQYLPPHDQALTDRSREISEVRQVPFADAVASGMIREIPHDLVESYMTYYVDRARERGLASERHTTVVFTPLNGCGERTVGRALAALGYDTRIPAGQGPDGTFRNIPLNAPNPEVKEATEPAKAAAEAMGAGLVLASDPDADRMGAEVFHRRRWVHLTGNELTIILSYFILLDPEGPRLRGGVYQTIVTTLATRAIAERAGVPPEAIIDDLLTGFKNIARAIRDYEASLGPDATDEQVLAFASEEAHGYLDTPRLRDKDAMGGGLTLARLHERLAAEGRTLVDYLDAIYAEVGDFGDRGRSIVIPGSTGIGEIKNAMAVLRETRPADLGGVPVTGYADYWDTERFGDFSGPTDREARNIMVFHFDGGRITFRPSGTEPKLKFYVATSTAAGTGSAQAYADQVSDGVYQHVTALLGRPLGPAFASLPDVIPVSNKVAVQRVVEHDLREVIAEPGQSPEFAAGWLREKLAAKIPGESAWDIALPAIRATITGWSPEETAKVEAVLAARVA